MQFRYDYDMITVRLICDYDTTTMRLRYEYDTITIPVNVELVKMRTIFDPSSGNSSNPLIIAWMRRLSV